MKKPKELINNYANGENESLSNQNTDRSTSHADDRLRKQIFNEMTKRVLKDKENRKKIINKVGHLLQNLIMNNILWLNKIGYTAYI